MFWVGLCLCSEYLLHCVVGWLVFCVPSTLCCGLVVFYVPSTLCCGLVCDCVLCPFYTVLGVGLCSVSLLHCVVGWSVILFCVPSTLRCGLVGVLCPFYTVLWVGL